MAPMVEVIDVCKRFRIPEGRRETVRDHLFRLFRPRLFRELRVLDSVHLAVDAGEAFAIMGRNGCGKSTLLKVLCGIYPPDQGNVVVRAPSTPLLELGVGWNFELDATDNILLIGTCMGMSLRQAKDSVGEILAFAGLEAFASLQLKHFSSGMAARLAYATGFTAVQEVLIIDEIFAVGDAGFKARCGERFRKFHRKGHTLIVVSHDPRFVREFCTRGALMDQGRILFEGSAEEVVDGYLKLAAEDAAAPQTPAQR